VFGVFVGLFGGAKGFDGSTVGFAFSLGVAGQFMLSFPAWCVGGTVVFVINNPF
jgi:hypothetical protein